MLPPVEEMIISVRSVIREALRVIDKNAQGICFVVDAEQKLVGVLTDGDIRRALLKGFSLESELKQVMQTKYLSLPVDTPIEKIQPYFSDKIRHIPLTDAAGKVVDYAGRHRLHRIPVMEPSLQGNELAYVTECIQTSWISSQGKYVREFERVVAEYCGVPYALAVSNGTVALHLALAALEIGEGDEVIVPDLTFAATINAVLYVGATPVIVDVSEETWNIDPVAIEAAITSKTRAIIPVHLYGYPCAMDKIMKLAQKHNLFVVEDCAEALGSEYRGQRVGSFGNISTFSFFGNKTITTGEGGMVVFKERKDYERAAILRDHGMSKTKRYWHDVLGYNYRMTNLQAAIGVAQMERVETIVERKIAIAQQYSQELSQINCFILPPSTGECRNTHWLYTLVIDPLKSNVDRDDLIQKMLKNGIETRPVFYPLHDMPLYAPYAKGNCQVSSFISSQGISLPSSVNLTEKEISSVCQSITTILYTNKLVHI